LQSEKDYQAEADANRTQEALDREELKKNQLLSNDELTSEERARIAYDSETAQMQISANSKNYQNKLNSDFAKKEYEIKKQQFERNKALQITMGIINTAAAVLSALATVQPYPLAVVAAASAAITGAAQVAIISQQKFAAERQSASESQSIDTRGGFSSGGSSGGSVSPTPSFGPNVTDPNGVANAQTNVAANEPVKVYVLESDIRNVTNKINVIESRATFP